MRPRLEQGKVHYNGVAALELSSSSSSLERSSGIFIITGVQRIKTGVQQREVPTSLSSSSTVAAAAVTA